MNKILKKITSSALAAVISLSAAANVFAGNVGTSTVKDNKIYMVKNHISGLEFPADHEATGKVTVNTYSSYFKFNASTSIGAKAISNGCNVTPENFIIYVGWQVADYNTGDTISGYGGQQESRSKQSVASGLKTVPRSSSKDITVFGSHTAYKDGTAIMQKYTTTFSPDL